MNSNFNIVLLVTIIGLACSPAKTTVKVEPKADNKSEYASENVVAAPLPPTAASTSAALVPKLEVDSIPVKSDLTTLTLNVKSAPHVTHYSWKLATDGTCDKADGYLVQAIKVPLNVSLIGLPDGKVTLCMLGFDSISKLWQAAPTATIFSWDKIPFTRTLVGNYEEDPDICEFSIYSKTVIEINGDKGTSKWEYDPSLFGCLGSKNSGVDELVIKKNDAKELVGYIVDTNIWFKFKWLDKDRTLFSGTRGDGADVDVAVIGTWSTIQGQ